MVCNGVEWTITKCNFQRVPKSEHVLSAINMGAAPMQQCWADKMVCCTTFFARVYSIVHNMLLLSCRHLVFPYLSIFFKGMPYNDMAKTRPLEVVYLTVGVYVFNQGRGLVIK